MKVSLVIFLSSLCFFKVDTCSLSKVLTHAVFTSGIEGPDTDRIGDLYLVNYQKEGTIGVIRHGKQTPELFVDLPGGSVGNGIQFLNDSIFYVADYKNHNILKVNKNTREIGLHAHDNVMNQPNDIAISDKGNVYATDPNWKENSGQLWLVDTFGKTILIEQGMGTTNGVEISPDNKFLYINESKQRNVWKYSLLRNGMVSNKELFYRFKEFGLDGMRCDLRGNLYIARYGKGVIAVLSPEGLLIKELKLQGNKPTNLAFSPSYDKLYITLQDKKWVEVIKLK